MLLAALGLAGLVAAVRAPSPAALGCGLLAFLPLVLALSVPEAVAYRLASAVLFGFLAVLFVLLLLAARRRAGRNLAAYGALAGHFLVADLQLVNVVAWRSEAAFAWGLLWLLGLAVAGLAGNERGRRTGAGL